MSHDHSRRAACTRDEFEYPRHESTRRDGCGRWLWRLVGRFVSGERTNLHLRTFKCPSTSAVEMLKMAEPFMRNVRFKTLGLQQTSSFQVAATDRFQLYPSSWPAKQAPSSVTETILVNLAEFRMHSALTALVRMHAELYIEFFLAQRHR